VVVCRIERPGGVRWLVRHGAAQFESSDEHRAHRRAWTIARTESVRCFLSDEHGVRPLDFTPPTA
jgi:hypothetical protein